VSQASEVAPLLHLAEPVSSRRVLAPIERISEMLFGFIMVLTFTCSFSVAEAGRAEVRSLFLGALGCNLAWGVIDGIMYLMGCLAENARTLATLHGVRTAKDPEKARRLIREAMPSLLASAFNPQDLERIRIRLQEMPQPATHPRLSKSDWLGATAVFLLVVVSTFPLVLPFMLMDNALPAQRVSNAIAIALMFLTGYAFGRCTGYHPGGMGLLMVLVGVALVGLTILLGG